MDVESALSDSGLTSIARYGHAGSVVVAQAGLRWGEHPMNGIVGIIGAAVTFLSIAMGAFSAAAQTDGGAGSAYGTGLAAENGDPHAARLPDAATGIWGETGCDDGSRMFLVNRSHVLIIRSDRDRNQIAVFPIEWAADAVIVAHPDDFMVLPLGDMERCRALPPETYAGFGEAVALFQDIDDMRARCDGESPPACATAVFSTLDISGDDRLSRAEIGRALRAAGFFMSYAVIAESGEHSGDGRFVPADDLYLVSAVSIFAANFLTANIVSSYDYDGDGFLSLEETLQDRFPDYLVGIAGKLDSVANVKDMDSLLRYFSVLMEAMQ